MKVVTIVSSKGEWIVDFLKKCIDIAKTNNYGILAYHNDILVRVHPQSHFFDILSIWELEHRLLKAKDDTYMYNIFQQ